MLPTTCKNGHPLAERVWRGTRWRCLACVDDQNRRRKERERANPELRRKKNQPIDANGCVGVCLCEEL